MVTSDLRIWTKTFTPILLDQIGTFCDFLILSYAKISRIPGIIPVQYHYFVLIGLANAHFFQRCKSLLFVKKKSRLYKSIN